MRTVWKFPVALNDEIELKLPRGAEILDVHAQADTLTIWVLVDDDAWGEVRRFTIVGTGQPLPVGELTYRGTAHCFDGALVWHLFELGAS